MYSHFFVTGMPCMNELPLACPFNVVLLFTFVNYTFFVPLSLVVFFTMNILIIVDYVDDYVELIPFHCLQFNSTQCISIPFHT